jgi:hypothetical protein
MQITIELQHGHTNNANTTRANAGPDKTLWYDPVMAFPNEADQDQVELYTCACAMSMPDNPKPSASNRLSISSDQQIRSRRGFGELYGG